MATPVRIFVSVRDRARCTVECVNSLISTCAGEAAIHIFDNGSEPENVALANAYKDWAARGDVAQIVANRAAAMPVVYWSKNFAWAQFLALVDLLPAREREYLVMVDNDVVAAPGWLDAALQVLNSDQAKRHGAVVVSPYDGPPRYEDVGSESFGLRQARLRERLVSRFWVARYEWWKQFAPPPWGKIIRDGEIDRCPTDWWYWTQMKQRGERFAVLTPPFARDPKHKWISARMTNGVGADATDVLERR